jgi:N-acetylmuramoyl-L-alanine amidase
MISKIKSAVLLSAVLFVGAHNVQANTTNLDSRQIECLTLNTYKESRGESEKGQLAVIFTVLNRVKDSRFPSTPCKVIAAPHQFSWYRKDRSVKDWGTYNKVKELVKETIAGEHRDPTQGAVFFHASRITPSWSRSFKCTAVIGNHKFYK